MAEAGAKTDLKSHEGTYGRFISLFKVGTIVSAILAAVVVFLISR